MTSYKQSREDIKRERINQRDLLDSIAKSIRRSRSKKVKPENKTDPHINSVVTNMPHLTDFGDYRKQKAEILKKRKRPETNTRIKLI